MSFFDELSKKITQTGQTAVQKTRDFADITKLNSMISDETHHQEELYAQIGKQYYERYAEVSGNEFEDLIKSIIKSKETVEQYQMQIKQIKGITNCPACGAEVPFSSAFCDSCGERIVHNPALTNSQSNSGRRCPACGAAINDGQKFCISCGNAIAEIDDHVEEQVITNPDSIINSSENTTNSQQSVGPDITHEMQTLSCPDCGAEITDDDLFCVNCGSKLK